MAVCLPALFYIMHLDLHLVQMCVVTVAVRSFKCLGYM